MKQSILKFFGIDKKLAEIEHKQELFQSRVEAIMVSESKVLREERNTIRQIIKQHFPEEVNEIKRKDGSIILEKYKDRF